MKIPKHHSDKKNRQDVATQRFPSDLEFLEGYTIDAVDCIRDRYGCHRIDFLFKKGIDFHHIIVKINQDGDRMNVENETAFLKNFYKGVNK